jgi:hypothetical protein
MPDPFAPARRSGRQAADAYPEGGSVAAVLAWVGDDPDRARHALDAEHGREQPRSTVVRPLEQLLGG